MLRRVPAKEVYAVDSQLLETSEAVRYELLAACRSRTSSSGFALRRSPPAATARPFFLPTRKMYLVFTQGCFYFYFN